MFGLGLGKRGAAMRAILLLGFALGGIALPGQAATFTVTSYGEESDAFPGDSVAEIQPGTKIATLHAAIEEANAFPGPDTIVFDLAPNVSCNCEGAGFCRKVLRYTKPLPPLNDPTGGTTIDGFGLSWWSGEDQDGTLGDTVYNAAFVMLSANNVVRNFTLWNFPQDGIVISGPEASGNVVERMRVGGFGEFCPGTDGVNRYGVLIEGGAAANAITGNSVVDAGAYGIALLGEGTENNLIVSNFLGQYATDGDAVCGVDVDEITEPTDIRVQEDTGLPDFCKREHLENFLEDYVTDTFRPNRLGDIYVAEGASFNTIGSESVDGANFIGGGVWIVGYTLEEYKSRGFNTYCADPGETPLFKRGDDHGIVLDGPATMGNRIIGNFIGYRNQAVFEKKPRSNDTYTMYPARDMSGNSGNAVIIRNGASDNVIGDADDPTQGNLIRYSYRDAVVIEGGETDRNAIYNNAIGSEENGITIEDGPKDTVVGAIGAGNVLWTREYGMEISGSGTERTRVEGNDIYFSGFSALAVHGEASDTVIGGTAAGAGNRFRESCSDGVIFFDTGTMSNQLIGNEIYGNGEIGVFIVNGASNNIIGGSDPGAGNAIYNNAVTGVEIHDVPTTGNQILGNDIHGNGTRGVFLVDGTSGNVVGGELLAERNRIYDNELSGIEVNGALTVENKIRINSIYDNNGKGILLSFGSNAGIQPPVIERFVPFSGTATPGSFVDAFADSAEEGRIYIGTVTVDESGAFSVLLNLTPHRNLNLTATATDLDGNSSEFSLPLPIIAPTFPEVSADRVIVVGDDLELSVTVAGSPEIALQWQFRPDGGTFAALEEANGFSGVTSDTLALVNGQAVHEGFYRCVADNGLGAVNSREIFVRVVPADLNELQVNALSDTSDGDTSSFGRLLASPGEDGVVTLREAILAANTMPGDNIIRFAVEGAIPVESPLPAIDDSTGALILEGGGVLSLDGSGLDGSGSGLRVTSSGNRIAGLAIFGFPEHGVHITGSENTVVNCAVGRDGDTLKPNGANGILLSGGASDNLIGGAEAGDGNTIDGSGNAGIMIEGAGTSTNRIQGNTIGDPAGGEGGNALAGILITQQATDTTVGGTLPDEGNTIAGNTGIGVYVTGSGTAGNTIRNNAIFNNGDLGIRLFEGGNDNIARPVVASMGPVTGTAPADSLVDGYLDAAEEGETPLFTVMADAAGNFTYGEDLSAYDGVYLTVTATDAAGNTSAFSLPFPIDFTNPELTLNGPLVVTLECGEAWADPGATATDNLDGDITANVVATLLDGDGEAAGAVESAPPGDYTLTYTVSDASGLAAAPVSRAVTIEDTAPPALTLSGAETVELTCGTAWDDPGALAVDACDGEIAVAASGAVDTAFAGVYTLTYTAEDSTGNAAPPLTRTVTVLDAGKPAIILNGGPDLTVACGEPFEDPGATALDACEGDVAVTRTGMVDVSRNGLYVLTYNASDSAGNAADPVTRSVTVADQTAPLLVLNGDAEVSIICGQGYVEEGATLTDACDPGTEVTISGDFNPNVAGIYTRFYDAVDGSGNRSATLSRTITVIGGSAPSILLTGDASVSVPCNTAYEDAGARAVDGCQTDITADIVVDNPVDTSQPGVYTITYTVMDATGAAATPLTRTVSVLPCVAPCDDACDGEADDAIDADGDGLSRCKEQCLGTSDSNPDTDGDGMPDGFEYENGFNALADDGDGDADLDGLSNTDEFLADSLPRDSDSPLRTFFVGPVGVDLPEAGTRAMPWQTIGFAMNRISPSAASPVRLVLDAGVYVEDVTVKSHAALHTAPDAEVELMGTTVLRANSTLQGITLSSDAAGTGIVFLEGGAATVRDCTFNGEFGENLTGIVIESQSTPRSIIEGILFQHLDTGIDISGALPAVRRCAFANITVAAILVRDGTAIAATDSEMGHGLNGWNDFGATGAGLAIRNATGAVVSAQWNDWGTDSVTVRQEMVEGTVNQGNALAAGTADAAAALEIVVSNGASQARLANAAVALTGPGGAMNATTGADGRVTLPVLPAGSWQVAVTAAGFPDGQESVTLQAGARSVVNVVLIKEDTDPTPEPPAGCPAPGKASSDPASARGDLVLFGLLLAGLAVGKMAATGRRQ